MTESQSTWKQIRDWISRRALTLFRRFNRPVAASRPKLMLTLAALLVAAAGFSWWSLGLSLGDIDWVALFLTAALVPVSVLLTASEYRLIASVNQVEVGLRDSIGVTVVGAVANLLPLPGAAVVRFNDLIARRSRASGAIGATAAAGILWLGWSLFVAGLALTASGNPWVGVIFASMGGGIVLVSWLLVKTTAKVYGFAWLTRGSAIELASLAVGAVRLWLSFVALGIEIDLIQAGVLVASGAISSTVGIVPGGLGTRELIAGLLAPLVGVAAMAAVLAVTLTRVVGLLVQAPIALAIVKRTPKFTATQ